MARDSSVTESVLGSTDGAKAHRQKSLCFSVAFFISETAGTSGDISTTGFTNTHEKFKSRGMSLLNACKSVPGIAVVSFTSTVVRHRVLGADEI